MSDTFLGAISEASNGPDMDILDPPLSPEGMEVQSMARRHAEMILIDRASDIHDRSVLLKASVAAAGSFPALLRILMAREREAF